MELLRCPRPRLCDDVARDVRFVTSMPFDALDSAQPIFKSATGPSGATLSFFAVNGAGHMVPMDQPENALEMVQTFTSGGAF